MALKEDKDVLPHTVRYDPRPPFTFEEFLLRPEALSKFPNIASVLHEQNSIEKQFPGLCYHLTVSPSGFSR